ncbi:MAG: CZB domain-containing protein [Rhodospirillum sp.]|nr:CZB domain-containing protein [Rhodospirillum sp.]
MDAAKAGRMDPLDFMLSAEDRRALEQARPVLERLLPSVIDAFYDRISGEEHLASLFGGGKNMDRAKGAQKRHWQSLFRGAFDDAYRHDVRGIGLTHHRVKLEPNWYIAGYGYVLKELLDAMAPKGRGGLLGGRGGGSTAMQKAVVSAVLYDIQGALSAYWDNLQLERTQAVEAMVERISDQAHDMVNAVSHFTEDLNDSVGSLTEVCDTVDDSATQARSEADQSLASAETVSSAAEELSASIGEIARQVSESTAISREAVREVEGTRAVMDRLNTSAEEIGEILDLISNIAAQTNLLALNATIEAARAGDAGKGFAVVAGEVKNLANQSSRSAEEIAGRVGAMRSAVTEAVGTINRVGTTIGRIEEIATAISAAVEEQSAATQEIARTVQSVASTAKGVNDLMGDVTRQTVRAKHSASVVCLGTKQISEALVELPDLLAKAIRTSSDMANRRRYRRRAVLIDVVLQGAAGASKGIMRDLSDHGCFIETDMKAQNGEVLRIETKGPLGILKVFVSAHARNGLHVNMGGDILPNDLVRRVALESAGQVIELAKTDHLAYVKKIEDALKGRGDAIAAGLATHHNCRLGRWYDAVNDPLVLELDAYIKLSDPHQRVHEAGRACLMAKETGKTAEVPKQLERLHAASKEVVSLLDILAREVQKVG